MSDPNQIDLLLAEASALSHAARHEEALARVEQALVLAHELADPAKIGRALDSKAWCLRMAGLWTEGGKVAQEAADHYAAIGDRAHEFDALVQVVSGYGHGGHHGLSVAAADHAIELARDLADASRIGQALDSKSWALRMAGQWVEGGKIAQEAADHYAAIGDKAHEFEALLQVVSGYGHSGQHELSVAAADRALALARELGDVGRIGQALDSKAWSLRMAGQWTAGGGVAQETADHYAAIGDKVRQFEALLQVVSGYGHGGQHELSVAAADRALALARELGDVGRIGQALDSKAWALRMAGQWTEGGKVAMEAADQYAAIGDKAHEFESLLQVVSGFGHGSRHYEALSAAARAVSLAEELGDQEKIRRAIESRDWAIRMAGGDVSQFGFLQQAPIATLSRNDNQIDLFAVGLDGRVLSAYWNRHWFDFWFSIGESRFAQRTPIAALDRNPDQMDFWAVRPDGRVEGNWWNGSWHDWFTVGESVFAQRTPIAALSRNQDQMDLFAVGLDGRIYNAWWNGNPWREWGNIGEARFAQDTPIGAISRHPDHMEIWAVGLDGQVYGNWWDGNWHEWFVVPPTLRLNFAMQRQLQGNWCWAATAVSVAAYYTPSTAWTQCSLADRQLGRGDCCTTGGSGPCNVPNSLADALDLVDHLDDWIDNIISRELLKDHMVGGRPICASIAWQGGGAHAVAITGYARGDLIEIDDPGPGVAADVDYDVFTTAYNSIGTWTHTYFTES